MLESPKENIEKVTRWKRPIPTTMPPPTLVVQLGLRAMPTCFAEGA
jgi:hypothetical protein